MNNSIFLADLGSIKPLLYVMVLLDLILKGITLYKSAQKDQKIWFVALLVVNSLGILPIIYLIVNKDVRLMRIIASPKKTVLKKKRK